MLKQQSHIVAPIEDELRTRAIYTVQELRERGKADKVAIEKLKQVYRAQPRARVHATEWEAVYREQPQGRVHVHYVMD